MGIFAQQVFVISQGVIIIIQAFTSPGQAKVNQSVVSYLVREALQCVFIKLNGKKKVLFTSFFPEEKVAIRHMAQSPFPPIICCIFAGYEFFECYQGLFIVFFFKFSNPLIVES